MKGVRGSPPHHPCRRLRALALPLLLAHAAAQANIYTCVTAKGQRLTSDRPIPECLERPQEIRNADGSVKAVVQPPMTAEERAAHEEKLRQEQAIANARRDAVRQDRTLLNRYPTEAKHENARETALEPLRSALHSAERRLREYEKDQKALQNESEFYKGKQLPRALKQKIDQNRASIEAQKDVAQNQQAEIQRITATFDQELARLRRLWAGAAPGSLSQPASASASR